MAESIPKCKHGTSKTFYCHECGKEGLKKARLTKPNFSTEPGSINYADNPHIPSICGDDCEHKVADSIFRSIDWGKVAEAWEEVLPKGRVAPEYGSSAWRKERPLATGCLDYFPDALLEVAHCSFIGNLQHHENKPLHWDKSKSKDERDALARHLIGRDEPDIDDVPHDVKVAWRALASVQRRIERERKEKK